MKKLLTDWRIHLLAFVLAVIAEMIGRIRFDFGVAAFSLFPMFYALILGAVLGGAKLIPTEMMEKASPFGSVCVMMVVAKCGTGIGPNLDIVKQAGIAMILQEFGSIFTVILAMPVAILIFHMGRAAVGCSFSISREEGIAIIGGKYGLDSQEGVGVMGGYVTGTILGTLFLGIVTSLIASLQLFHPYALAMACGAGSTSMMTAGIASVIEYYPDMADQITAFATSSNVLSSVDSFYKYLFITLPMCNVIYRLLTSGNKHYKNGVPVKGREQSTQAEREEKE
ncbi:MAG: DUF3100 domain-containing protein [Clostridiales bacterium]|nr:DUF3100 domain-containing protein [Clostridiales bacterium]